MRSTAVWRLIFICLVSILCCSYAKADTLPVGTFSFDLLQTGPSGSLYGLDVFNGTQPGGGSQVSTFLNFSNLALTLSFASGGTSSFALTATDPFGDFSTGAIFSAGQLLSATLTGTFSATTVTLADGSIVNISPTFSTLLTDPTGGPLQDADLAIINATTAQSVPEPSTLLLLLLGISCVVVARQAKLKRALTRLNLPM